MKNRCVISLYAKIHDENIKNVKKNWLSINNDRFINDFQKIKLTNEWKKYTFHFNYTSTFFVNAPNADIKVIKINNECEWAFICYSFQLINSVYAHLTFKCNTLYLDNLTYNNFVKHSDFVDYSEWFKNVNNVICKNTFEIDNDIADEIFKNYKGSYISNKFVLTNNVKRVNGLFSNSYIKALPTNFKINRNFVDVNNLCKKCKKLKQLSIGVNGTFSKKRFPKMITPRNMFYGCKNLKNIPIKFYKKDYKNELHHIATNFIGLLSYMHEL